MHRHLVILLCWGIGLLISSCRESTSTLPALLTDYKRLTDEEKAEIRNEKIDRFVLRAMREADIDLWITLTREYNVDPIAPALAAGAAVARTAIIFMDEGIRLGGTAIAASYDVDALKKSGIYDTVISYRSEGLMPHLRRFLREKKPRRIGANFAKDTPIADGLSVSMHQYLKQAAGPSLASRMVSAEHIVVTFRGRKTPREIEILKKGVAITEAILAEALSPGVIEPGVTTEIDLANSIRKKMDEYGVGPSWDPAGCPSINTGTTRGHSEPTDALIQPGHVVTIDFGVNLDGYCTDIQRTAYVLKPGEANAPEWIKRMWEVNKKAVLAGFDQMKPGNTGLDVDNAARRVIVEAGYQEYPHAAGHPIGYITHEVGPLLGPDWPERYGTQVFLKLEAGQVFALEPAVSAYSEELRGDVRIGQEEDVLITEDGPVWMGDPQQELILIKSG